MANTKEPTNTQIDAALNAFNKTKILKVDLLVPHQGSDDEEFCHICNIREAIKSALIAASEVNNG